MSMGVYIKGMEMPKEGNEPILRLMPDGTVLDQYGHHLALKAVPAADARPVVTCADCKYNTREVNDLFGNNAIQCITGLTHRRDWFCADGKKREES